MNLPGNIPVSPAAGVITASESESILSKILNGDHNTTLAQTKMALLVSETKKSDPVVPTTGMAKMGLLQWLFGLTPDHATNTTESDILLEEVGPGYLLRGKGTLSMNTNATMNVTDLNAQIYRPSVTIGPKSPRNAPAALNSGDTTVKNLSPGGGDYNQGSKPSDYFATVSEGSTTGVKSTPASATYVPAVACAGGVAVAGIGALWMRRNNSQQTLRLPRRLSEEGTPRYVPV